MRQHRGLVTMLVAEAIILVALLTVALDQYAHAQGETAGVLNRWGYRGAVARQRAHDETRLMMVGGTRAFQPNVPEPDTISARLRFMTEQWVTFDRGPVTAINLALPGLPRGAYAARLDQFRELAPDLICIYVDLAPGTRPDQPGLVTKLTGYVPAQPLLAGIDRRLGRLVGPSPAVTDDVAAVAAAVDTALSISGSVIVAVPEPTDNERKQLETLRAALSRLSSDPRVAIVELKDGPPAVWLGLTQPADAIQIDPAVRKLLQAQRDYR
jgi:hypothetical protein